MIPHFKFYLRNHRTETLDGDLFRHPSSAYRGAPFWSWNNELSWKQPESQIDHFQTMGMGGFHIHVRTGLATSYMGDEFMALVKACAERSAEEQMLVWLYDEDRWPSGYGGGTVTQEERFRSKHLLFTGHPYGHGASPALNISGAVASRNENGRLVGRYDVVIEDGILSHYRRLQEDESDTAQGQIWYAYLETAKPVDWFIDPRKIK